MYCVFNIPYELLVASRGTHALFGRWCGMKERLGVVNKFVVDNKIKCEHAKYTCRHTYTRVHTLHVTITLLLYTLNYCYIDIIFPWPPPIQPRSDNRDGAITNNIIILYRCTMHITVKK